MNEGRVIEAGGYLDLSTALMSSRRTARRTRSPPVRGRRLPANRSLDRGPSQALRAGDPDGRRVAARVVSAGRRISAGAGNRRATEPRARARTKPALGARRSEGAADGPTEASDHTRLRGQGCACHGLVDERLGDDEGGDRLHLVGPHENRSGRPVWDASSGGTASATIDERRPVRCKCLARRERRSALLILRGDDRAATSTSSPRSGHRPMAARTVSRSAAGGSICGCARSAVIAAAATRARTATPRAISGDRPSTHALRSSRARTGCGATSTRWRWSRPADPRRGA